MRTQLHDGRTSGILPGLLIHPDKLRLKTGTIAAMQRVVILDRRAVVQIAHAIQQHQGRARVYLEQLSLTLVGGHGFQRAMPAGDYQTEMLFHNRVKRLSGQVGLKQVGAAVIGQIGGHQDDGFIFDETEALDLEHRGIGREIEKAGYLGAGRDDMLRQNPTHGRIAVIGHILIKAGQLLGQILHDLRFGDKSASALGADNQAVAVVLSGAEEAELAYTGASLDVPGDFVVLDVGGGSTELITRASDGEVEAVSLDLGASRATERWIASDPPSPLELAAVYRESASAIELLRPRFGAGTGRLVGVAGTVTTLACRDAGLQSYSSEAIHLRTLSLESVDRLVARLAGMTVAERAALPCVQAGRASVIVGGAVIVKAAMEALGYGELTVSERDLLDGLVLAAPC